MIGRLPTALSVGGGKLPIRSDFRVALGLFDHLGNDDLTENEKAYLIVKTLFKCDVPDEDFTSALKSAVWFLDGGDMPKSEPQAQKLIDWSHDEQMIMPAVSKVAGCSVRSVPYLHWWDFLGYMGEIGEGLWSTVINIRYKRANGKKLEKHEREFLSRHKELVILRSRDDLKEIDALEKIINGEGGVTDG